MKILLTALNSKFVHSNLAIRYLKAYTKDLPYEAKLKEFSINDREEKILQQIINEEPDVVAFSTYIWNVEMVKDLAHLVKLVKPNVEILFGGPEVSFDSRDFLQNNVGDYIIEGEGEETYKEFVQYKLGEKNIDDINGLHYKRNEEVISNPKRPLMNMDNIVFPYEDDEDLNNKIVYYESSRGCPFNCKYCLSSTTHGVRFHNIDRVKKELQYFIDKKVRLVKFVDRTFNCNHKHTMAIWEYLIKADTDTKFHFEISADILKDSELELLKTAPALRFQFEVGVQTTNNDVLNNINRFVNFEDIKEKVLELESMKNIKQHLDLIAGLPGEDLESFIKSFNDVHSILPEEIQLGFLKLLRGSKMREESSIYGMVYSPKPPYEILSTNLVSYNDMQRLKKVEEIVDKYYNSGKFKNILKFFYKKFETPFEFYDALGDFFEAKNFFNRNIGNSEYYKVFLDFNIEILKGNEEYLIDIIRFDYLEFNKMRGMPEFMKMRIPIEKQQEIKEKYRGEYSFKDFQIEAFSIDMDKYIEEGEIEACETYYLISDSGSRIRIN